MEPLEIRPWRESPFITGRRYRIRRDFVAPRDRFAKGEVLTYERHAWSRHDEVTGYFFSQQGADHLRVWDVRDDEDLGVWRELFEEV